MKWPAFILKWAWLAWLLAWGLAALVWFASAWLFNLQLTVKDILLAAVVVLWFGLRNIARAVEGRK